MSNKNVQIELNNQTYNLPPYMNMTSEYYYKIMVLEGGVEDEMRQIVKLRLINNSSKETLRIKITQPKRQCGRNDEAEHIAAIKWAGW